MNFIGSILVLSLICASCLKTSFGSVEISTAEERANSLRRDNDDISMEKSSTVLVKEPKVLDPRLRRPKRQILASGTSFVTNRTCICTGNFSTNANGKLICLKDCKGKQRPVHEIDCKFPFYFNGSWVHSCTNVNKGYYWCSLDKIYTNRSVNCSASCPLLAKKLVNSDQLHTSCRVKAKNVTTLTIPQEAKNAMVMLHNLYRSKVSVPAADMRNVTWDDDMASLATKWAEVGKLGHDCDDCRRNLNHRDFYVGQNVFQTGATKISNFTQLMADAVGFWAAEVKNFLYGNGSFTGGVIGHYTQVINAKVSRIGCGAATVNATKTMVVCNYGPGQLIYDSKKPYLAGPASTKCNSTNIINNLCQCTRLCRNGGTLNPLTCTCTCPKHTTGKECENFLCDQRDSYYGCWDEEDHTLCEYSNTAPDCPHLCGICDYSYANVSSV